MTTKRFWLLTLCGWLGAIGTALAPTVLLFNPVTGRELRLLSTVETLHYMGASNALIQPVLPTNDLALYKVTNSEVVLLNAEELEADWLTASNRAYVAFSDYLANLKTETIQTIEATNDFNGRLLRALAEVLMEELNLHAQRQAELMTAIDNAASLAALKTAAAAIPDLPQRTLGQLKTALVNKLSDD